MPPDGDETTPTGKSEEIKTEQAADWRKDGRCSPRPLYTIKRAAGGLWPLQAISPLGLTMTASDACDQYEPQQALRS